MEIKDLTGIGEPLSKLIDAIRAGIGVVIEPIQIRRVAEAKAYELKLLQSAKTEASIASAKALQDTDANVLALVPGIPTDVLDRARQRITFQEVSRQGNLDAIVAQAIEALPTTVNAEPVNTTWMKRFFNVAADVDDEKMQGLWGKILAGETAAPGRFSLRTIEVLRNLSQHEAELFVSTCHLVMGFNEYVMTIPNDPSAFVLSTNFNAMKDFGIPYNNVMTLADAGLVYPDLVNRTCEKFPFELHNNGRWLDVDLQPQPPEETGPGHTARIKPLKAKIPPDGFPVIRFTEAGRAIGGLVENNFNQHYFELLAEQYKAWGIKISLRPLSEQPLKRNNLGVL